MTKELKGKEKYVGMFPFAFDDDKQLDADIKIPDVIHLIPIGQWEHDAYGPILITNSDIREFAQNFNAGVRKGVFITAGHEGFTELPAMGWITAVEIRDTGLWGVVDWNEAGKACLKDKAFKFFSPEYYRDYEDPQTHQMYRNVLTGGALTKSPYFKELEAVVTFSEKTLIKKFNENNNNMNLQELVGKKIEDLTAEEITFIKENAEQLTEDQKTALTSVLDAPAETAEEKTAREEKEKADADKATADAKALEDANIAAGLNADGTAKTTDTGGDAGAGAGEGTGEGEIDKGVEKVEGSDKVTMSSVKFAEMKKQIEDNKVAMAEIAKAKLDTTVKALVFSTENKSGKFLPKSEPTLRAFMEKLSDTQRLAFAELVKSLPEGQAFKEIGSGVGALDGTAQAEVQSLVKAKMSEKSDLTYADALKQVFIENKGLAEKYNAELKPVRKGK